MDAFTSELFNVNAAQILPRMLAALLVGAALSSRVWRVLMRRPLPKGEMIQSQMLLCTAAAVITAVIGDSMAKAFGLVGLGGFVRFRSGLKDPRDAAIFFLMIGFGMACGHGSIGLALFGAAFVGVILFGIDLFSPKETPKGQRLRLSARSENLERAEEQLRTALGAKNVIVTSCALDFFDRRLELELEEGHPGDVAQALNKPVDSNIQELRWTTVQP